MIIFNSLSGDRGQRGPFSPYKLCNHSEYIGIHEENHPLKIRVGFWPDKSPLSTARVLIDAVGLCLLRVSEV